jgi:hypothetical protein
MSQWECDVCTLEGGCHLQASLVFHFSSTPYREPLVPVHGIDSLGS